MTDPIRPRIDFDLALNTPAEPPLRATRHFTDNVGEAFIPQPTEAQEDESGKPEALITYALAPKSSLWRAQVCCY